MFKIKKSTDIVLCGGRVFKIYHWSPTQVIRNMPKIGRLVAVPMGTMAGSAISQSDMSDALPTAILYVLDQLDNGGSEELLAMLLEGIEIDGFAGDIDIDAVFEDHVDDLITLLGKVVEVNYGCFFGKSGFGTIDTFLKRLGLARAVEQLDQSTPTET